LAPNTGGPSSFGAGGRLLGAAPFTPVPRTRSRPPVLGSACGALGFNIHTVGQCARHVRVHAAAAVMNTDLEGAGLRGSSRDETQLREVGFRCEERTFDFIGCPVNWAYSADMNPLQSK